jgi:hypothetical protein
MTRVRRVIVAGSRDLSYTFGTNPTTTDYDRVRNAIWEWERAHGAIERIASGANGYVQVARGGGHTWNIYGRIPKDMDDALRIVGGDLLGEWYGRTHMVPIDQYPYMREFGKAGGPMRNARMVADSCGLVVVRYPDSRGSADVLVRARERGLHVVDVLLERPAA